MGNESLAPPDIQEQLARQRARQAPTGIGSSAPENTAYRPQPEEPPTDEKVAGAEPETCASTFCDAPVKTSDAFCSKCGFDQLRGGLTKKLGIDPFTEEEVQDYIFRGYVVRDIKVLGRHKVTVRSSQAKDLREIDAYIMNGDWSKAEGGKEKQVSEFFLRQMNALCLAAMAIQKVDGNSIGETLDARMSWLQERGSALVDILAQKTSLFNQALTEHLKKEDTFSGS